MIKFLRTIGILSVFLLLITCSTAIAAIELYEANYTKTFANEAGEIKIPQINSNYVQSISVTVDDKYSHKSNPYDIPKDGLAGHFHMDESSGSVISDSSGNVGEGTLVSGTINSVPGKYDSAINTTGNTYFSVGKIDASYTASIPNNATHLDIPTYDGSGQAVHPDVCYFESGFNGYKYWMVFTPYPNSDSYYENPSIVVSQDGCNWVVPPGLNNPIIPDPDGIGGLHNSDPDLVYDETNGELRIYYLNGVNVTMIRSYNGITWSDPIDCNVPKTSFSPSVVRKSANEWYMFTVSNYGGQPHSVQRRTSVDGISWSEPTSLDYFGPSSWHVNAVYDYDREQFIILVATSSTSPDINSDLILATSEDGIHCSGYKNSLILGNHSVGAWDEQIYRSCMVLIDNTVKIWYSANVDATIWYIGYKELLYEDMISSLDAGNPGISCIAWVNPSTTSGIKNIIATGDSYALRIKDNEFSMYYTDGSAKGHASASYPISTGTFSCIGATYNGKEINTYLNGKKVTTTKTPFPRLGFTNKYNTWIGSIQSSPGNAFQGVLDECIIYDRSLSDAEMVEIYSISTKNITLKTNSNSSTSIYNGATPSNVLFGKNEIITSIVFGGDTCIQDGIAISNPTNTFFNATASVYPLFNFDSSSQNGNQPLTVKFTTPHDGEYWWDFENDGIVDSTKQNPVHTYGQEGTYSVKLIIENYEGELISIYKPDHITVEKPTFSEDPIAWFNWVFRYISSIFLGSLVVS